MKKKITKIKGSHGFLLAYDYPGNIRELKNIIERMVVLTGDGVIRKEYLPGDLETESKIVLNSSAAEEDHLEGLSRSCGSNLHIPSD